MVVILACIRALSECMWVCGGGTLAARYGQMQLDQFLLINRCTASALSLDRIRELLQSDDLGVPKRSGRRGMVEVVNRLHIADGVELV